MVDPRFFENLGPIALGELAARAGARLADSSQADHLISAVAPVTQASPDAIAFIADRKHAPDLTGTKAGAVFLTQDLAEQAPAGCAVLITPTPQGSWAMAADMLHRLKVHTYEDGPVHPTARLEKGVLISPGAVIGPGAEIGGGTVLGPNVVVGPGVTIGRDCRIGPLASLTSALVGDRVTILAGARIGEAGFGVAPGPVHLVDIPQLGRAILQDGVTVGANSCIDRGAYDDTIIGEDTKLDNLVHVAHNSRLGRACLAAAFTGISGSVIVGDGVRFGGRAGIADHLTIGAGAQIGAASGVMRSIPAGETWSGLPAQPIRHWLRQTALLHRLVLEGRVRGTHK